MSANPLLITDQIILRLIREVSPGYSVFALSTRQLAELSGTTRRTVSRALARLLQGGRIEKIEEASGNRPAQWRLKPDGNIPSVAPTVVARIDPRHIADLGVHDIFRRRDLRGPGALYEVLPDQGSFTAVDLLRFTDLTGRVRTIEHWLLVLASLPHPLVTMTSHEGRSETLWSKVQLPVESLDKNVDVLLGHPSGLRLLRQQELQLRHQLERVARMFPRGGAS